MSCKECSKKNDNYFIELGKSINKQYGKFTENDKTKYIPLVDFYEAQEKGYINKEIQIKAL